MTLVLSRRQIRCWLFVGCALPQVSVWAGIDQPWNDPSDGGGTIPGASILFGVVAAVAAIYFGMKDGGRLSEIALTAFIAFFIGVALGLPVACVMG